MTSVVLHPTPVRGSVPHRAVLAAFVSLGVVVGSWGARVPDIRARLDLSEGSLGAALFGLSVGAVVGSWASGLLVRRFGSRSVVTAGWVAMALTVLPPGLSTSWGQLTLAVTAFGLAIGLLDVAMNGAGVQLDTVSPEPLISGLHAGWSAGMLVGTGACAVAVAVGVPTNTHLAAVAVLVGIIGGRVGPLVPDGRIAVAHDAHPDADDHADVGAHRRRRARRLAALAGIGGAIFLAEGTLLDWAGVLVREDLEGGPLLGVLAVTGFSAGGLAGRLASDRLAARWGPDRLIRAGIALATAAFLAAILSPWAGPVPLLLVAVGVGTAPSVPLAFAAAGRSFGEHGIAVVTTAGYGAYLAGPAIIGGLAHAADLRTALVLPLALVTAVAALAWSAVAPGNGAHPRAGIAPTSTR